MKLEEFKRIVLERIDSQFIEITDVVVLANPKDLKAINKEITKQAEAEGLFFEEPSNDISDKYGAEFSYVTIAFEGIECKVFRSPDIVKGKLYIIDNNQLNFR